MGEAAREREIARLRLERELLLGLLALGQRDDLAVLLADALALVVRLTGAEHAMIEVRAAGREPVRILHALAAEELESVRREVSSGIIAEALVSGRTVSTASAIEDPRFGGQASVQAQRIRAVLCAPLGDAGGATHGVLYLAGRSAQGPFPDEDRALVELFAERLTPLADRIAVAREEKTDRTAALRARVRAEGIAGTSSALAEVLRQLLVAAPVPVSVLITGETGTGKTALARALHASSPRAAGPFVEVNCAAIPETLFESELFGAEKGAHSTATRRIDGKIDTARSGTLFLDEVGELPLAVQAKLLGFLQSRRYHRLGGTVALEADVRIVAATNRDLGELVAEKRFREDLQYRLDVLRIHVPPLRERSDDIGAIAESVLARLGREHGRRLPLSRAAVAMLEESEWPGNVRELENVISRGWATALADDADAIEAVHLFPTRAAPESSDAALGWKEATLRFQRRFLRESLDASQWNVSECARRLGLARSHLNELIGAHGLARPD